MKRCALVVSILALALGGQIPARATDSPAPVSELRNRIRGAMAVTDSIRRAGDREGALAHLDALYEEARAADDSVATCDVMRLQSYWWRHFGNVRGAVQRGYEALDWATALRDTSRMCSELYKLGLAVSDLGENDRADSMYAAVLDLSLRSGDEVYQARAYTAMGHRALYAGDPREARAHLEAAVATLHRLGQTHDELLALNLLGFAWSDLGDFDRARTCFERCLALAEQVDYDYGRLQGMSNLAYLENHLGDPGKAAEQYLATHEFAERIGVKSTAINAGSNYSSTLLQLGRAGEAVAMLETMLEEARSLELAEEESNVLVHLGAALFERNRLAESIDRLDEAMARSRQFDFVSGEFRALRKKAEILEAQGDLGAAIALLEGRGAELRDRVNLTQSLPMQRNLAELYLERGEGGRAVALLREVDARAEATGQGAARLAILASLGDAYRHLDRPDSTRAVLSRASRVWEEERSVPSDPEWREQRGSLGRRIYTGWADAILRRSGTAPDDDAVRAAFDMLQRYKARTLWERRMGPAAELADARFDAPDLETVQSELLAPGEILLDAYLGDRVSLLFVVRDDGCRVRRLPPAGDLDARVALFAKMLSDPRVDESTLRIARAAVRETLFEDLQTELAEASRVVFLPDGSLNLLPLASLWPERPELEVARVPSLAILATLRNQPQPSPTTRGIVAVAGRSDDRGNRLEGALTEVEDLSRRYRSVRPFVGTLPSDRDLGGASVVHFAAHTRVDDARPWRSGLLLAASGPVYADEIAGGEVLRRAAGERPDGASFLDARRIAELDLGARLAVLSGCESAGGRVLSGEGVQGLASAFLSARVQTVVATLWPVDDGSTQRFMGAFYRALEAGATVAGALRAARLELRQDPATAHPFHWSGFVALGDGTTRVTLERRASLPSARTLLGVLGVAGLLLVIGWRRSSSA